MMVDKFGDKAGLAPGESELPHLLQRSWLSGESSGGLCISVTDVLAIVEEHQLGTRIRKRSDLVGEAQSRAVV